MQSLNRQPIYLPDVESNPQPTRYLDLIRTSHSTGRETWNIWHLSAFRPEMTSHLARFTPALEGPRTWSLTLKIQMPCNLSN
jgi:hypothetical protein